MLWFVVQKPADHFDPADLAEGIEKSADCPWQRVKSPELLRPRSGILIAMLGQIPQKSVNQWRKQLLQMRVQQLRPLLKRFQLNATS